MWHGKAGSASCGMVGLIADGFGKARQARLRKARPVMDWHGTAGRARTGMVRLGVVRLARQGTATHSMARTDTASMARLGMV